MANGNTSSSGSFIQPYSSKQTEAKLLILQRRKPELAAAIGGALGGSGNSSIDPRARAAMVNIFSQEANGGGGQ